MEIIINDDNVINYEHNSKKATKSIGTTFSDTFNQVIKEYRGPNKTLEKTNLFDNNMVNSDLKTGINLIDNLPTKNKSAVLNAIADLNNIFNIDILNNTDKFLKKDSTINITIILGEYGNNVSSSELNDLSKSLNTLFENGIISNEDYFSALKWILTKQQAFKIQMKSEENKSSLSNLILNSRKNNNIHIL